MTGLILASISALSLVSVGVYAVIKQRTAANLILLLTALLLGGIGLLDQVALQPAADFATYRRLALFLEALLPSFFLALSIFYGRNRPFESLSKVWAGVTALAAVTPLLLLLNTGTELYYSQDVQREGVLFLGQEGYWYYLIIMVSLIAALSNIEATLAASKGQTRNRMKFEAIGLMCLIAVLFFYYSQGLLYRTINMNLAPVRSGVSIIAALLIGYSHAFRGTKERVSISRYVIYRSIALLVVGVYLLGLGLIGEGMRYFGDTFGRDVALILAFAAGVVLLIVLFSEKARRKTKVYINKHFYAHKHDYREEWIKFTSRLSSCHTLPDVQDAIVAVYEETYGLAGASLYIRGNDQRFIWASGRGMMQKLSELRISEDLRAYFVDRDRVLNMNDGEFRLSEFESGMFAQAGAWLVVPLVSNGVIEGLAVLRQQIISERLSYEDFDLMKVMARQAAHAVANFRLSEENTEMRSMAAVSRFSAFVLHDLKNLTTGLSLMVENAEEHIGNPEFQKDAIATMKNSLVRMKGLIQRLKSIPEKINLAERVEDLDHLTRETIEEISKIRPGRRINYSGARVYSRIDGEEIKKVIVNLVQNALEACDEQGIVTVETHGEGSNVNIVVSDTGCGMTKGYMRDNLFKPFSTTKEKGLGIGLYQCRQIVEAHNGRLEARSTPGKGSVFSISLPSANENGEESS